MRLLVVTPRFVPDMGGVERHVLETTRRLAAAGVDVTVLTVDPTRRRPRQDEVDGIALRRVPAWPQRRDWYAAPGVYDVIVRGRWDVMHLQSWHTLVAPLAMLAARRARLPYIVTPHGRGYASPFRTPFRPLQRRSLGPLLRRAEHVVALVRYERQLLLDELGLRPERVSVLPNGSDLEQPARTRPSNGACTIVSVGRLERFKGHHRMIEALPLVLEREPGADLAIIGEGPYEGELRRLAAAHGVGDRVHIQKFGMGQRGELATRIADARLLVLLSDYEMHPIAVLEAAALGTPALVTDVGGMREIARDGVATAVAPDIRAPELAAAVSDHLAHPRVPPQVALISWDQATEELLRLYRKHAHTRRENE